MELLIGMVGAVIGGIFALAGSLISGRVEATRDRQRFEHERKLAADEHARSVAVAENERLRQRIELQLDHGRRVLIAASRFQSKEIGKNLTDTQRLFDAAKFARLNWDEAAPYHTWVPVEEFTDDELKRCIGRHRQIAQDVEFGLAVADGNYSLLPPDCMSLRNETEELARNIQIRIRTLQIAGTPL